MKLLAFGLRVRPAILCLLLALAVPMADNVAAAPDDQSPRRDLFPQSDRDEQPPPRVSARQASETAQKSVAGRVISVQPVGQRWRVRIDQDGRVVDVFVDANTGRVLRPADED